MENNLITKPEIRFSFDDSGRDKNSSDDVRLANLLRKYNFKNIIFYVLPYNKDLIKLLAKDFKIGAHTITHPILRDIPIEMAK